MAVQYAIPFEAVAAPAGARGIVTYSVSANTPAELVSLDIGSSYLTSATLVSLLVEIVTCTAVGTGGAAFTPKRLGAASGTAVGTARTGDITTDVTSPSTLWTPGPIILPGGPFDYQWPLGREAMGQTGTIYAVRVTPSAAVTLYGTLVVEE